MKSGYIASLVISSMIVMAFSPFMINIAYGGPPSIPTSIEIAVGYGDTEYRGANVTACANCFPSPWCGSPSVQFIGSSLVYNGNSTDPGNCVGGDWDGGAILVTNAGDASITLTGLTVTLPLPLSGNPGSPSCAEPPRPVTFDLWFGQQYYYDNLSDPAYLGGPITIPPQGQAIFAGTTSDGAVCPTGNYPSGPTDHPLPTPRTYDFDTSDANFLTGCTVTNDTVSDPQITFSATGYAPTTYIDKGHVIDTGGIDTGNCNSTAANPQWPDESLGWRLVSSTCGESCPTNQLGVPTSATTQASAATASGLSQGLTLYAAAAVAIVVIVAVVGFGVVRRKKPV